VNHAGKGRASPVLEKVIQETPLVKAAKTIVISMDEPRVGPETLDIDEDVNMDTMEQLRLDTTPPRQPSPRPPSPSTPGPTPDDKGLSQAVSSASILPVTTAVIPLGVQNLSRLSSPMPSSLSAPPLSSFDAPGIVTLVDNPGIPPSVTALPSPSSSPLSSPLVSPSPKPKALKDKGKGKARESDMDEDDEDDLDGAGDSGVAGDNANSLSKRKRKSGARNDFNDDGPRKKAKKGRKGRNKGDKKPQKAPVAKGKGPLASRLDKGVIIDLTGEVSPLSFTSFR
jgi:hypothetical protein